MTLSTYDLSVAFGNQHSSSSRAIRPMGYNQTQQVKWSLGAEWLIAARAYPGFCGMKRQGVFLLPLDGMLVHCWLLPHNLVGFPNNSSVPIYTPGWRETLWEVSVLPKNTTQCPRPKLEPGPLAPGTRPQGHHASHNQTQARQCLKTLVKQEHSLDWLTECSFSNTLQQGTLDMCTRDRVLERLFNFLICRPHTIRSHCHVIPWATLSTKKPWTRQARTLETSLVWKLENRTPIQSCPCSPILRSLIIHQVKQTKP